MKTNIYVNLPVKDLEKTKKFFEGLGYKFNPQFTDDKAACLIICDDIFAMLVMEDFFKKLARRDVADNTRAVESAICITMDSKEKVDQWADKAISLGATENEVPEMKMEGFMYGRSLNDLDGHIWEVLWMDPNKIQPLPT